MKLVKSFNQYCDEALQLLNKAEYCLISSFNMTFVESSDDKIFKILNKASKIPHKVIIGISTSQCIPNCNHCITNNAVKYHNVNRLKSITSSYRIVQELHMKAFITSNGIIIGGMNITNSGWIDRCLVIKDKEIIKEMSDDFKSVYNIAKTYEMPQYIDPKTHFTFGKYKGQSINSIKASNPQYIAWLKTNQPSLSINL